MAATKQQKDTGSSQAETRRKYFEKIASSAAPQNVLQFQSLGTLDATSGLFPMPGPGKPAGMADLGVIGFFVAAAPASLEVELDAWLLLRLFHTWNCKKQWLQERHDGPLGLKFASWSKGTE